MRTFILAKAYTMLLGDNSNSNFEKAKELINLVGEFDKQQKEEGNAITEFWNYTYKKTHDEGFDINGWDLSNVTDFSKAGAVVEERKATKDISLDDFQKCFKCCTAFNAEKFIIENIQNYSLAELLKMFNNCKDAGD